MGTVTLSGRRGREWPEGRKYSARRAIAGGLFALVSLAGCGTLSSAEFMHRDYVARDATWRSFPVCVHYGCRYREQVSLSAEAWAQVVAEFSPVPATAGEERVRIARAIGRLERLVAPQAGTALDEPSAATLGARRGQLDCLAEAVNSMTYLHFMDAAGLFRFHRLGQPLRRGFFIDGWPHNTATIYEIASDQRFVVDSYFRPNGWDADIMPAEKWQAGWEPSKEEMREMKAAMAREAAR